MRQVTMVRLFQSAPGSMSREERAADPGLARAEVFQSAPGSMSRENPTSRSPVAHGA